MANQIQTIPLDKLTPHPANPNKMSKANFAKLVRNIERTGRYEPLIVRPVGAAFQIINGHHRWLALKQLGKKEADAIVWDIDDGEVDILLATLNRLCGQDMLDRKLALLKRLSEKMQAAELAKLLPQTKKQIQRLTSMFDSRPCLSVPGVSASLCPMVFFVSDEQQQVIETTLNFVIKNQVSLVRCSYNEGGRIQNRASRRASALSAICQYYLDHSQGQHASAELEQFFSKPRKTTCEGMTDACPPLGVPRTERLVVSEPVLSRVEGVEPSRRDGQGE